MHITDVDSEEYKIFVVPDDDPRFADFHDIEDLPGQILHEIEQFIVVYEQLEGDEEAEVHGWLSAEEAQDLIRDHAS